MRIHWFQHVPFEDLGSISQWLLQRDHTLHPHQMFNAVTLPDIAAVYALIVMGGPMSVNDTAQLPWLAAEKQFIRQMLAAGKPVLGICLGAQLIASALGAKVYPKAAKEIGWWPLQNVTRSDQLFQFPAEFTAFHWHGETFDLPEGAALLASNAACQNQAFQLGDNVIGLQFHLETTADSAAALVKNCAEDLTPSPYVQSVEQLLNPSSEDFEQLNSLMAELLEYWLNEA
jgi:GMP synthase-like glutamine amidotransferase